MLSHFAPGVKIYKFVALRKFGPYLYKSVRHLGGGGGVHIYINLQDLGEVGGLAYNGVRTFQGVWGWTKSTCILIKILLL